MQILVKAEWQSYEKYEPFHSDKEIRIAGLFASVQFRGDVYEWRVREAEGIYGDIDSGWVDSMGEAVEAAEAAIRKILE
jgi:hypothetical protein